MVHIYYSYRMYYYCDCLPFSHLDDCEFQSVSGCWSIDPSKLKTSLFDLITNPDKFDECDPDHILPLPSSDYYSVSEISSTCGKSGSNALTLFHFNIKSLPKNLSLLHDILYCLDSRPNIIAISETRLNENSVSNIELPHYYFFHHDSPTAAGGAGLYVSKNLKSIPRPDLSITCRAGRVLLGRGRSL